MIGTVVHVNPKGFGFTYSEDLKRRVFFHFAKFSGAPNPEVNMVVEFELAPGFPGQPDKAINVRVVNVVQPAALDALSGGAR